MSSQIADAFYDDDQRAVQATVRHIINQEVNPHVDEWESMGQYPAKELFKKLGKAGLLGVDKPVEYGGLGLDVKHSVAINEALGCCHCGAIPMSVTAHTDMATPALARFGSDRLRREFLAPSISGDFVSCIGVSEPNAGSDVASIKTSAKRVGGDLVINGQKMWVTNGFQADWICLLANTSASEKAAYTNKSLICVPMNSAGITLAKKIDKLGMRASDTAVIYLDDVRVPADNIIGEEGQGFMYQMIQFQQERLAAAALTLVPMDTCIEETIEYTKTRQAFGQPLIHNQYIHFTLAELKTEVEMLRAGIYQAIDSVLSGHDATLMTSMVKLKSGRLSRLVADRCLQFWGGMGFTNDVKISRFYRDLRVGSIGGGADEVMLGIICKLMGTLPSRKR